MFEKVSIFKANTMMSLSHFIGSMTIQATNIFKAVLPDDFLKEIRFTTEEQYSNMADYKKSLISREKPLLIVDPKKFVLSETEFLDSNLRNYRPSNDPTQGEFFDPEWCIPIITTEKSTLMASRRRHGLPMMFTFVLDSEMQAMRVYYTLAKKVRHGSPMVLERVIETNIPDDFILAIAEIIYQESGTRYSVNDPEFMKVLNQYSNYPITYRIRPGSGNKEFFIMHDVEVHMQVQGDNTSEIDVEKVNAMVKSASFQKAVAIEVTTFSEFHLHSYITPDTEFKDPLLDKDVVIKTVTTDSATIEMVIAEWINAPLYDGKDDVKCKLLASLKVQFDRVDDNGLEFIDYLPKMFISVYDFHKDNGHTIDFLHARVYKGLKLMDEDEYEFNPDTLEVKFLKGVDRTEIYTIAIYCDNEYVHRISMMRHGEDIIAPGYRKK